MNNFTHEVSSIFPYKCSEADYGQSIPVRPVNFLIHLTPLFPLFTPVSISFHFQISNPALRSSQEEGRKGRMKKKGRHEEELGEHPGKIPPNSHPVPVNNGKSRLVMPDNGRGVMPKLPIETGRQPSRWRLSPLNSHLSTAPAPAPPIRPNPTKSR